MNNLDSVLISRDVTLSTKVRLVKAMVFPVVMYWYESWTIKKPECWRIYAFKLWCWRRLLRVPWTVRRYNQSILKEVSPGCSLEGLMLKLKPQYFGHLMQRADSLKRPRCRERLRAGGEGDDRGWDGWMASPTWWTWVWVNSESWWWTEAWRAVIHGVTKSRTQLSDWTELITVSCELRPDHLSSQKNLSYMWRCWVVGWEMRLDLGDEGGWGRGLNPEKAPLLLGLCEVNQGVAACWTSGRLLVSGVRMGNLGLFAVG